MISGDDYKTWLRNFLEPSVISFSSLLCRNCATRAYASSFLGFLHHTHSRSQWSTVLRRGSAAARLLGLRVRIPPEAWMSVCCGARFSAVQTGPGTNPASCKMGTGSFPGVEIGRGVTLTPIPLLVQRSKNRVELYLYSL